MFPEEPGVFSQAMMSFGQPAEDPMADPMADPNAMPMGPPQDPGMGMGGLGMGIPGGGMADPGMDEMSMMGGGGMMPQEPMEDPSAEESRVVEDLIRNYLFEKGRKRLEATRQYQENVIAQNEGLF